MTTSEHYNVLQNVWCITDYKEHHQTLLTAREITLKACAVSYLNKLYD